MFKHCCGKHTRQQFDTNVPRMTKFMEVDTFIILKETIKTYFNTDM
jgi:hypothetical protein